MSVVVEKNDITQIKCDAIVNPANSMGFMGTGVGKVPRDNAAETIVTIAKTFEDSFETIYLIDRDEEMVKYFKMYI
jgi:O-acetyl-ADP-ribose deacetylase (regulator of RNase III)